MPEFSLSLDEDQLQIQKWVHDFAETVIRPVAHEWDEREETPWPVIREAAKIGLYSLDFMANAFADPTGILLPVVMEEMGWGDAGITLAIFGTSLAVSGILGNGTPEQIGEWLPQCFGTPEKPALAAFCVSEPDAGSDVSSMRTGAVYDEATDEWVLNGTKTWITNGGIADVHVVVASVDPALKGRGQASFIVPPGTRGLSQGRKFAKMGIRASHTAEVVLDDVRVPGRLLLGGKDKLDERLARARSGQRGQRSQAAMATFEASRPMVGRHRRRHRPGRPRIRPGLRQGTPAVWAPHHREPGHRLQAGRHGDDDRCRPSARVAGIVDGRHRPGLQCGRGLTGQAVCR